MPQAKKGRKAKGFLRSVTNFGKTGRSKRMVNLFTIRAKSTSSRRKR